MTPVMILAGIGLWFFIEGAIYAIAPDFMRRMAAMLANMSSREVAVAGAMSAAIGVIILVIAVQWT